MKEQVGHLKQNFGLLFYNSRTIRNRASANPLWQKGRPVVFMYCQKPTGERGKQLRDEFQATLRNHNKLTRRAGAESSIASISTQMLNSDKAAAYLGVAIKELGLGRHLKVELVGAKDFVSKGTYNPLLVGLFPKSFHGISLLLQFQEHLKSAEVELVGREEILKRIMTDLVGHEPAGNGVAEE